jgi:hypothetical protein
VAAQQDEHPLDVDLAASALDSMAAGLNSMA